MKYIIMAVLVAAVTMGSAYAVHLNLLSGMGTDGTPNVIVVNNPAEALTLHVNSTSLLPIIRVFDENGVQVFQVNSDGGTTMMHNIHLFGKFAWEDSLGCEWVQDITTNGTFSVVRGQITSNLPQCQD